MTLIIDDQFRSNIRVFNWNTTLLIEERIEGGEGILYTKGVAVILIRSTTNVGQEVIAMPYPGQKIEGIKSHHLLLETMKSMPLLGSCDKLNWLAVQLSIELGCKFRPSLEFPHDHPYVFFFDLQINLVEQYYAVNSGVGDEGVVNIINQHAEEGVCNVVYPKSGIWDKVYKLISCICEGREDPSEVNTKDTSDVNTKFVVSKVNKELPCEIEKYLITCPGMIAQEPRGMREVIGAMDIDMFVGSEENEIECPICYENICAGNRIATTFCSHKFHRTCIGGWLRINKSSCPICRSSFHGHA